MPNHVLCETGLRKTTWADPERFVRGGPTLTVFCHFSRIKIPLSARQRNAIRCPFAVRPIMAWQHWMLAWFLRDPVSIAKKPYIFVIFQGGGGVWTPCPPPPPLWIHLWTSPPFSHQVNQNKNSWHILTYTIKRNGCWDWHHHMALHGHFYFVKLYSLFPCYRQILSSAHCLCKQLGPGLGPTECRSWSGPKLFDTLLEYLKEFFEFLKEIFEKVNFEKSMQATKKEWKITQHAKVSIINKYCQ